MKSKFLFPAILIAGLILVSFSVNQVYGKSTQIKPVDQQTVKYTCPQHPEVVQDKPGKCPKCGMTLVEQKDKPKGDMNQKCDSTKMKNSKMKMMNDTSSIKHDKKMK